VDTLLADLHRSYPKMTWMPRIRFGGLLDVPNRNGETRVQLPVMGMGVELISPQSPEIHILNVKKALVRGRLPKAPGEMLVSDDLAGKLQISPGVSVTLISTTMDGSLAMQNFNVVGTIRFGVRALDRASVLVDLKGAQEALDMDNAVGEILGFFPNFLYRQKQAIRMVRSFNERFSRQNDDYSLEMVTLADQNNLADMLSVVNQASAIIVTIFVFTMSIVLWNAGLMAGLRRYGEIGVRLAMGEEKGHIYRTMIYESAVIGTAGSLVGTAVGLAFAFYLQSHGLDMGSMLRNSSVLMSNVMRAQVTPTAYYIGFIPGVFASILGTMIAGIGIYRRQTAQLFKELEA
ncbi:MAG: FtsX-like permease family protein, partial [Calditrichaeota bacterium]|nr:FtsX-like permease family protein [Calditrichota bacterium]